MDAEQAAKTDERLELRWLDGPSGVSAINAGEEAVRRGGEIILSPAQYEFYVKRGFSFEPSDRRRKLPDLNDDEEGDGEMTPTE